MNNGYAYLASPYSDPNPRVMEERYYGAAQATAWFLRHEIWVYCPIVHCHPLAVAHSLPTDYEFWREYDRAMLRKADELFVLCLDGWQDSRGVQDEVLFANGLNIKTSFFCAGHFDEPTS